MFDSEPLDQRCHFETERLLVASWKNLVSGFSDKNDFADKVVSLMTPVVTGSLPEGWQDIDSREKAADWIKARADESTFLTVQLLSSKELAGFVFLHDAVRSANGSIDLKIGYLLSEVTWGKGLGSELIDGLVTWCERAGDIASVSGGVDAENLASIRVLEKNGFRKVATGATSESVVFLERHFR
ncbi:GNAT family N-acetyltransferase [Motiliproteus sp. MSK22-1]|uniref:GNAT family N-acetyltransferase n=1 Tax=Motiliproteus sp. MSK22-1 TaxID=1897630 RepID=UPI0009757A7C|nr:GNAT family N-acetyltransferase [Motiliproteus sp. MSK22-1]OMH39259.1 hypothetical protein BGP75_03960 [Motiliproteus sp. MSK22-1]